MSKYQAYPEYKDSGVKWLGEVPSHWTLCRIKDIAMINASKSEVRSLPADSLVSFLPMESIGEKGELDTSRTKLLSEVLTGYTYVANGDLMIAKITPCFENGKGAIADDLVNGVGFATTEVIPIRPVIKSDAKFLFYLLNCDPFKFMAESSMYGAGGQKRVADSFVAEYHLTFPLKDERNRIANFLDHETAKIDTLIEQQQQLIQLLKEKRQAVISHAVTKGLNPNAPMKDSGVEWLGEVPEHWEGKSLNYLIAHTVDNRGRTPPVIEEGIPMCEVSQVAGNGMYTSNDFSKFISKESHNQFVRSDVKENDVLFVTVGATFGKTCLVPPAPDFFIAQNVVGFRCKHDVDPKYFMFLLSSDIFKEAISATNKSSTIDNVKVSDLVRTKLAVPPLIEQTEIANYIFAMVDKYEALIDQAMLVINLLQERRTALISAAVTGKIDVRSWQAPTHQ